MHAIRKGQIRWVAKGDPVGQRQFIHTIFDIALMPPSTHAVASARLLFATEPGDQRGTGGVSFEVQARGV